MDLKDRVRTARKRAGMTHEKLAELAGVTRVAVVQWESGKTKSLKGSSATRAAAALGVSPTWLSTGEGRMQDYAVKDEAYTVPPELARAWQSIDRHLRTHLLAVALALAERKNKSS